MLASRPGRPSPAARAVRVAALLASAVTIAATLWIVQLPDEAECRASGRIVDPTLRHCESGAAYQQLQGHATFHAFQVAAIVIGLSLSAGAGYAGWLRYRARR